MSEIVDCIAFIIRKTCWSLYVFFKFLLLRLLDLLGLIFNVAACCTIIRLPFMIAHFVNMHSFADWRLYGLIQLIIFITDLPIILMALVVFVTLIRVYPCCKDLKETWDGWKFYDLYYTGFGIRLVVMQHFFTLFIDVFCIPSAVIVLLSWRSCRFVSKFKNAENDWKRRKLCFVECAQIFLDIPLLLAFVIVCISWRLPFVIYDIKRGTKKARGWNEIRFRGLEQMFYLFVDIPCFVLFLITIISWRSPILVWQLNGYDTSIFKNSVQWRLRSMALLQFLYLFVDVPCIVMSVFLFATLWRLTSAYSGIKKVLSESYERKKFYKKEFKVRNVILQQFGMIFVDLFCFGMALFVLMTLWRTYPLLKDFKKYWKKYRVSTVHETDTYGTFEQSKKFSVISSDASASRDDDAEICNVMDSEGAEVENEPEGIVSTDVVPKPEEEDEQKHKHKPLSWNKFTWKLRKMTCIHFVMFFIDLPAIPLAILLIVTVLRTTKFISAILGSGNFYMMFAITVYYQTARFFLDLCCVLLFLVLMILRPVQSWVHLLEDEEHKKYRLLDDITVWMPDIVVDRVYVNEHMMESIALDIKRLDVGHQDAQNKLTTIMDVHLERLDRLRCRLQDNEIEDEFGYLLSVVMFHERKRVNKIMRKFTLERNFIQRADTGLHDLNVLEWTNEMREFNQNLDVYYEKLKKYKPEKVPLYETKTGLSLRSRKETRQVLLHCLPRGNAVTIIMALLCCIPLYRMPTMIRKLFMQWYNRFEIVIITMKEYALDALALLRILIVLVCVYRAPMMLVDIFDCIVEKRSWKAVRHITKKYPAEIASDIVSMFVIVFSWETPRFLFTALLFGLLIPADLFMTIVKIFIKDKCLIYVLTLIMYVIIMGFPFVFTFYVANYFQEHTDGRMNVLLLCAFSAVLLFLLLLMVMALIKDQKKTVLLEMPKCDYVRLSWYNINVFLFEILEFLQTMALIFKLQSIPMYGSETLENVSKYLLFSFLPFESIFWITVFLFVVWFFLCAAPVILENILESFPVGSCAKRSSWRLAMSLFANTLFVTMIENLTSFSACRYQTCPVVNSTSLTNYSMINSTFNHSSCVTSTFMEDDSFQCWTGDHKGYAAFGLVSLAWYSTTSLIFGTQYGDPNTSKQDIGFSPVYNTVVNILKVAMITAVTIITEQHFVVVGVLLVCNLLLVVFTLTFRALFKYSACNLPSILVWRVFTFVSCGIGVIAVLVAYIQNESDSKIPLLSMCVGIFIAFVVSFIFAVRLRRTSDVERDRENFKKEILSLEGRLLKNGWLSKKWNTDRKTWYRLVNSVREASRKDKDVDPKKWELPELMTVAAEPEEVPGLSTTETNVISDSTMTSTNDNRCSIMLPQSSSDDFDSAKMPPPPSYYQAKTAESVNLTPSEGFEISLDLSELQKNGKNLLLTLEKHIRYEAYRYSFLTQRTVWLNAVIQSDWSGLLQCLRILNRNIEGSYDKPTFLDISLSKPSIETDKLQRDPQDEQLPPTEFVKLSKEAIAQHSEDCRQKALNDFTLFPNRGVEWSRILDKLLPVAPVFKSWNYSENISFELISRRVNTGTIVEIEENGNKLAIRASFTIGKILRGHLSESGLAFEKGFEPIAKKGPVKIALHDAAFILKNDNELYLVANGKKVKYEIAMASCKTIKWS